VCVVCEAEVDAEVVKEDEPLADAGGSSCCRNLENRVLLRLGTAGGDELRSGYFVLVDGIEGMVVSISGSAGAVVLSLLPISIVISVAHGVGVPTDAESSVQSDKMV
jgi:hypothetical protein